VSLLHIITMIQMNKRELIAYIGNQIETAGGMILYKGWVFSFDFADGYRARKGETTYQSFDDLAAIIDDMFNEECFDD